MAEGLLRSMAGARFEVASAGTEQTRVNRSPCGAMREIGIDIGGHESKTLDGYLDAALGLRDHGVRQRQRELSRLPRRRAAPALELRGPVARDRDGR